MIRNIVLTAIFSMLFVAMLGCSQPAPIAPDLVTDRAIEMDGHELWGYYHLYLNPDGPSVEVVPARQAMKHYNVKPFVTPPKCLDCVKVQPTGPYHDNILPLDITLKNPEPIGGYDVRGILLSDDEGVTLNNPDNYTGLFDNGGPVNINPFKAFAKTVPNRKFAPGISHTKKYDIYLSKFGKVAVIDYAVDASWPARAKEPYQIDEPVVNGEIDSYGKNEVDITVDVYAAEDDVDEVWFDLSSLGVSGESALDHVSGTTWKLTFQNTVHAGVGQYQCMSRASTSSSTKSLYSYFTLPVVPGSYSLQNDVQPIFNIYCISCHMSVTPPLGLDLTEGNTYANTVNVDAEQSTLKRIKPLEPQFSYVWGKLMGFHEGLPFFGSGDRMPKDGPPYLTNDEILVINDWVVQGALDN